MNSKIDGYIAEEEISDIDLFRQVDELRNCCSKCDNNTNCIKLHFTIGNSKNFDFPGLCCYVRR